jgi:hypothetical protein
MSDRLDSEEDSSDPAPKTPAEGRPVLALEHLPAAWLVRELERCHRGWDAGAIDALVDVLRTCEENTLPLPQWVYEALSKIVADYSSRRLRSERQRMNDLLDFERWDTVTTIRECRPSWKEEAQYLREVLAQRDSPDLNDRRRKDLEEVAERLERFAKATVWTDGKVYAFAADELARDPWHGRVAAETVRASYMRVTRRLRNRGAGRRYYLGLTVMKRKEAARHESAATRIAGGVAGPPLRIP